MRQRQRKRDGLPASPWMAGVCLAVLCLEAAPAHAQSARPDTRKMTCEQAQDLVRKNGSLVMTTGPTTFDRFVADARYCMPQTRQVRAKFAPTSNNPDCAVGYRCYQNRRER
ncbi:hypothetical protein [Roseibium sp. Sym1]|uniref:hypothetical protein n=1 Tax=Roseibium sp. Sym1 TaxID=3016006 RepID=UPI0022B3EC9D|nr:hypothetical protein [Roseibium sp. Sym1]